MRHLTEKATRDAAAVKVLTVITLIYLPATVVSVSWTFQILATSTHNRGIRTSTPHHLYPLKRKETRRN
jgi:hypothetical protein